MTGNNTILLFFGSNYEIKFDKIESGQLADFLFLGKIEKLKTLYGGTFFPFPLFSQGYENK